MLKLWFRVALFSATTDDQEVETITGFDLLKEEDAQRVAWQKESSQIFNLLGVSLCAFLGACQVHQIHPRKHIFFF